MINFGYTMLFALSLAILEVDSDALDANKCKKKVPEVEETTPMEMQKEEVKEENTLPMAQRKVLDVLSPLYRRIYLYALGEEQREMVAVFYKRGENPYRAIDNILRRDRKKNDESMRYRNAPSRGAANTKKYFIISEEEKSLTENS